ncbi:DUF4129 domain-containing protein [Salarchaeum sp. JOR-1]|uniref:DUF4129 domain-containing protein n=1 Tax=Salarchaeum sp. JOR-1 TaxID=2599399 RepID=UPI0011988B11|nr:DUF4129 domain-containing protein [Salarchaeum sp. JOR-1]QDX39830.1 DUF4129 domain-containing protein [Salarchaeum sp. JOR-1]
MKRNRIALVVALLVVVALGLAAATLANPTTTAGNGGGFGGGGGPGNIPERGDGVPASTGNTSSPGVSPFANAFTVCVPFLLTPTFFALAAVLAALSFLLVRWRTNTLVAGALFFVLFVPLLFIHAFLTKCGTSRQPIRQTVDRVVNRTLPTGGGGAGGNAVDAVTTPPALLLVVVAALAVLVYLFLRGSGDDDAEPAPEPPAERERSLDAVATAAGVAADRIEDDADVENAVYRAWRDMTAHLDIASPESTTPAEFARAARDAGMNPRHVDTLTDVFREVRYGDEPVTGERERRALDALRDIEAAYGGDEQ